MAGNKFKLDLACTLHRADKLKQVHSSQSFTVAGNKFTVAGNKFKLDLHSAQRHRADKLIASS